MSLKSPDHISLGNIDVISFGSSFIKTLISSLIIVEISIFGSLALHVRVNKIVTIKKYLIYFIAEVLDKD